MTEKRLYTVIDKEEPRGQSVALNGIPCTARHCVSELNALHEEKEQVKKVLQKYLEYYTKRAIILKEPCGDVTEVIHDIADELEVEFE